LEIPEGKPECKALDVIEPANFIRTQPPIETWKIRGVLNSVPLHFRKSGMSQWIDGQTVNISRTGILFSTEKAIPQDSGLDIRVDFPNHSALQRQCTVVRTDAAFVAVHITHQHLVHSLKEQPLKKACAAHKNNSWKSWPDFKQLRIAFALGKPEGFGFSRGALPPPQPHSVY
jgi:hypothetical protein